MARKKIKWPTCRGRPSPSPATAGRVCFPHATRLFNSTRITHCRQLESTWIKRNPKSRIELSPSASTTTRHRLTSNCTTATMALWSQRKPSSTRCETRWCSEIWTLGWLIVTIPTSKTVPRPAWCITNFWARSFQARSVSRCCRRVQIWKNYAPLSLLRHPWARYRLANNNQSLQMRRRKRRVRAPRLLLTILTQQQQLQR